MRINLYTSNYRKYPVWVKNLIGEVTKNFANEYVITPADAHKYIFSKEHLDRIEHAFKIYGIDVTGYRLQDDGPSWGFVLSDELVVELQLRFSE